MLAILLVGLVAACAGAPHFPHGPPPYHPELSDFGRHHYDPFADDLFDTRRFWAELATEMRQLDTFLAQFYEKFPAITSTQGVVGDEYKITIPMGGFEEKEIAVKAREGLLMVQAVHKMEEGGERSYLDVKTLPACVDVKGSWIFEGGVLKIVFPLKPRTGEESNTRSPMTEAPAIDLQSREDIDSRSGADADVNADVDADGSVHADSNRELLTNEIRGNSVEATTYAVDLNDEVEFVPVRYNK